MEVAAEASGDVDPALADTDVEDDEAPAEGFPFVAMPAEASYIEAEEQRVVKELDENVENVPAVLRKAGVELPPLPHLDPALQQSFDRRTVYTKLRNRIMKETSSGIRKRSRVYATVLTYGPQPTLRDIAHAVPKKQLPVKTINAATQALKHMETTEKLWKEYCAAVREHPAKHDKKVATKRHKSIEKRKTKDDKQPTRRDPETTDDVRAVHEKLVNIPILMDYLNMDIVTFLTTHGRAGRLLLDAHRMSLKDADPRAAASA